MSCYMRCNLVYIVTKYWNIGNTVKQCENLKKKLKNVKTCCFSTISVKICKKTKISNLKVFLALKDTLD